jgi:anti-sigma-K factor RskA
MNILSRKYLRFKRVGVMALALLALALYISQVADAWNDQNHLIEYDATRSQGLLQLDGQGLASSASAMLSYDYHGTAAVLQTQDLPKLPSTMLYQVWAIRDDGAIDASTIFRVAIDSQELSAVEVTTPKMLSNYHHFRVTIEPIGGSRAPTGPVVLEN